MGPKKGVITLRYHAWYRILMVSSSTTSSTIYYSWFGYHAWYMLLISWLWYQVGTCLLMHIYWFLEWTGFLMIMWDMVHMFVKSRFVTENLFPLLTCWLCVVLYYCIVVTCLHYYLWNCLMILYSSKLWLCTDTALALSLLSKGHIQVVVTRPQLWDFCILNPRWATSSGMSWIPIYLFVHLFRLRQF